MAKEIKFLTYYAGGPTRHWRLIDDFGTRELEDPVYPGIHESELRDNPVLERKIGGFLKEGWTLFQVTGIEPDGIMIVLTR